MFNGYDDRQPPQEAFRGKSPEYMAAFKDYSANPTAATLAKLMQFSRVQIVYCPCCGARMTDGMCWQGCGNEAALASQRKVDAAIIAAYEQGKPTKLCIAHADSVLDHSWECTRCATDKAIMDRWEIRVGLRCEVCGKTNQYCKCE